MLLGRPAVELERTAARWEAIAEERLKRVEDLKSHCAALEGRIEKMEALLMEKAPSQEDSSASAAPIVVPKSRVRASNPDARRAFSKALQKFDEQAVEARKKELTERLSRKPE